MRKAQLLTEAQKNLELKDKFLALAAHELRTPITSMSGYIQLIQRRLKQSGKVESDWIESLANESRRLISLIEEILDINKMNAGKLQYSFEECTLSDIVNEAMTSIKSSYSNTTFSQTLAKQTTIIGDKLKLRKAIYNILENAAKFSGDHDIEVSLHQTESYSVIIVQDFGKGIDEEDLPYIYEGFFKGRSNEQEGMGLGLFYTKNIIEGHKGIIKVISKKGKGTTVEMKLPIIQYG